MSTIKFYENDEITIINQPDGFNVTTCNEQGVSTFTENCPDGFLRRQTMIYRYLLELEPVKIINMKE